MKHFFYYYLIKHQYFVANKYIFALGHITLIRIRSFLYNVALNLFKPLTGIVNVAYSPFIHLFKLRNYPLSYPVSGINEAVIGAVRDKALT